jgi:hypothetical protein
MPALVAFEVNRDLRLDFDWFAVQIVRLVSPLANRLEGGC